MGFLISILMLFVDTFQENKIGKCPKDWHTAGARDVWYVCEHNEHSDLKFSRRLDCSSGYRAAIIITEVREYVKCIKLQPNPV